MREDKRLWQAIACTAFAALFATSLTRSASATDYATTSSFYDERYPANLAFDADPETRWASAPGENGAWIAVDLGEEMAIPGVRILWEQAYATAYDIEVSLDGQTWSTAVEEHAGAGGEVTHKGLAARGRYLRIRCRRSGPVPIYSIWEIGVAGKAGEKALGRQHRRWKRAEEKERKRAREALRGTFAATDLEEVIFVTRPLHPDGHWYANFSYYGPDAGRCGRAHASM